MVSLSLSLCHFLSAFSSLFLLSVAFPSLCIFSFPSVSSPLYLPRSLNQPIQISYISTLGPHLSAPLSLPLPYLLHCLSHLSLPIFRSVSFHCLLPSASFSLYLFLYLSLCFTTSSMPLPRRFLPSFPQYSAELKSLPHKIPYSTECHYVISITTPMKSRRQHRNGIFQNTVLILAEIV